MISRVTEKGGDEAGGLQLAHNWVRGSIFFKKTASSECVKMVKNVEKSQCSTIA